MKARVRTVNMNNKGIRSQDSVVQRKSQHVWRDFWQRTVLEEEAFDSTVYLATNITKNTADYQMWFLDLFLDLNMTKTGWLPLQNLYAVVRLCKLLVFRDSVDAYYVDSSRITWEIGLNTSRGIFLITLTAMERPILVVGKTIPWVKTLDYIKMEKSS